MRSTLSQSESPRRKVSPQPGPQTEATTCPADVVLFGGSAGGGKSYWMLLKALQFVHDPNYRAVMFRRTYPEIKNEGGLLDISRGIYGKLGAKCADTTWTFPSGARVTMSHMEHESDRFRWDGAQIAHAFFDQVEMFTRAQVFYMFSRLRSEAGLRGRIFMTANPPKDKTGDWLLPSFLDWYIGADGYAIPERSGVVRHFAMSNDAPQWGKREDLKAQYNVNPISFCFIRSSVHDNKILTERSPDYIDKLNALSRVDRERQLHGNWRIKEASGLFFKRSWAQIVHEVPRGLRIIRAWDLAATEKTPTNNPDFTASVKMGIDKQTRRIYILHAEHFQKSPGARDAHMANTAGSDGREVEITVPLDPGQAGKDQSQRLIRECFLGYRARALRADRVRGNKIKRFSTFSAQAEAGNIFVLSGKWNEEWISELELFDGSDRNHDDLVDATSDAFEALTKPESWGGAD